MSNMKENREELISYLNEEGKIDLSIETYLSLENPLNYTDDIIDNKALFVKMNSIKDNVDGCSYASKSYINVILKYIKNNKEFFEINLYKIFEKISLILEKMLKDDNIEEYNCVKFIDLKEMEFDNNDKFFKNYIIIFKKNENPLKILNILISELNDLINSINNSIDRENPIPLITKSGWNDRLLYNYKCTCRLLSWISNCTSFRDNNLYDFDSLEIEHTLNYLNNI